MNLLILMAVLIARLTFLSVAPRVCQAPCDVRIVVQVVPNVDNRWLVVQVDGPQFGGSTMQLEGDHAPLTQPAIWFKALPAGHYDVLTMLFDTRHEVARIASSVA